MVKLKRAELDTLDTSLQRIQGDLNALKTQVNQKQSSVNLEFRRLNGSLIHLEGPHKGKPFALTHDHLKELALTSVGYGLGLCLCVKEISPDQVE